jgi:hypothetical protein
MVKVAITIDTEEDLWSEYVPAPCPVENIDSIPLAQDIFDRYDAIPTYLVDYPVVIDAHASRLLQGILEKAGVNWEPTAIPGTRRHTGVMRVKGPPCCAISRMVLSGARWRTSIRLLWPGSG